MCSQRTVWIELRYDQKPVKKRLLARTIFGIKAVAFFIPLALCSVHVVCKHPMLPCQPLVVSVVFGLFFCNTLCLLFYCYYRQFFPQPFLSDSRFERPFEVATFTPLAISSPLPKLSSLSPSFRPLVNPRRTVFDAYTIFSAPSLECPSRDFQNLRSGSYAVLFD